MNNYYVYIYYRLDTNEPFYVGMGHDRRWRMLTQRNNHFEKIVNKYPITVEIIKDNLTEEQAYGIECWIINELVFEYGYSINIPKNRSSEKGCHLVNCTWGGEGCSGINSWENMVEEKKEERKRKISEAHKGKQVSEETRKKLSKASKGRNPWANMKDEKREEYRKKISNSSKGRKHSESSKRKISEKNKGKNSGMARGVICLTTNKIFYSIREAGKHYKCNENNIGEYAAIIANNSYNMA